MSRAQEILQLAKSGQLNTSRLYLLVIKTTPQEFKEMREELAKYQFTFSIVPDQKPEPKQSATVSEAPPAVTYSMYITTPEGVYLVATRGKEIWFAERGIYAI